MLYYLFKVGITAVLVVAVSEVAKRSSLLGAVLASLPLVSLLAIFWIYFETQDLGRIAAFSRDIIWFVLPSLVFFIALPLLLQRGIGFFPAMGLATVLTVFAYGLGGFLARHLSGH